MARSPASNSVGEEIDGGNAGQNYLDDFATDGHIFDEADMLDVTGLASTIHDISDNASEEAMGSSRNQPLFPKGLEQHVMGATYSGGNSGMASTISFYICSFSMKPDMVDFGSHDAEDEDVAYLLDGSDSGNDSGGSEEFRPVPDDDEEGNTSNVASLGGFRVGDKSKTSERSTMPKWLADDYADARKRLTQEMK